MDLIIKMMTLGKKFKNWSSNLILKYLDIIRHKDNRKDYLKNKLQKLIIKKVFIKL